MIFKGKRSFEHVTTYPLTQLTYQETMLKSIEMTHALQARQATKGDAAHVSGCGPRQRGCRWPWDEPEVFR